MNAEISFKNMKINFILVKNVENNKKTYFLVFQIFPRGLTRLLRSPLPFKIIFYVKQGKNTNKIKNDYKNNNYTSLQVDTP